MQRLFSPAVIFINFICGIMAFGLSAIFIRIDYALYFGLFFTLAMFLVMPVVLYADERKYRNLEQEIPERILAKENVNMKIPGKVRNGYFILTAESIYLICRDKKPYMELKIERVGVKGIEVPDHTNMNVVLADDSKFTVGSSKVKNIIAAMDAAGWFLKAPAEPE